MRVAAGDHGREQRGGLGEAGSASSRTAWMWPSRWLTAMSGRSAAKARALAKLMPTSRAPARPGAFRHGDRAQAAVAGGVGGEATRPSGVRPAASGVRPAERMASRTTGDDRAEVFAAGEFRDDAAVVGVDELRGDDVGEDGAAFGDDGGGGLVAGAFDARIRRGGIGLV